MTIRMIDGLMFGALSDPDAAVEHIFDMLQTKAAILEYIEPIAQVLAAAGRASAKAMGDSPEHGAREWSRVILERALEILREDSKAHREEFKRRLDELNKKRIAAK
jgi:hypothetical protein